MPLDKSSVETINGKYNDQLFPFTETTATLMEQIPPVSVCYFPCYDCVCVMCVLLLFPFSVNWRYVIAVCQKEKKNKPIYKTNWWPNTTTNDVWQLGICGLV